MTNGLGTGAQTYITANGGILTSSILNSMTNLVCGLSNTTVQTLSTSDYE